MKLKYFAVAFAIAASAVVVPIVLLKFSDEYMFGRCLANEGVQGVSVKSNGVNYVTIIDEKNNSLPVSFDFTCVRETSCEPRVYLGESRRPLKPRLISPEQQQMLKGVDVCRRHGIVSYIYRSLGMFYGMNR